MNLVRLDPAAGHAMVGGIRVPLNDWGRDGSLQVGGAAGPVLRPPRFGERSRVTWRALAASDPRSAVAQGLLHVATERAGDGAVDTVLLEIIALALAGADRAGGVFADTALRVARASGMDVAAIDALDAVEVDRLADALDVEAPGEWQSLVFEPAEPDLVSIRARFADRLLGRAAAGIADDVATSSAVLAADVPGDAAAEHRRATNLQDDVASVTTPAWDRSAWDRSAGTAPAPARERAASAAAPVAARAPHAHVAPLVARAVLRPATRAAPTAAGPVRAKQDAAGAPVGRGRERAPDAAAVAAGVPVLRPPGAAPASVATGRETATAVESVSVFPLPDVLAMRPVRAQETSTVHGGAADVDELARELARRLDDEAALRGVFR